MPHTPKQATKHTLLRQWTMLRLIPRAPGKISTGDLIDRLRAKDFSVELRTIQRDLIKLSEVLPLAGDDAKPQGWQWLPKAGQFDMPGLEPQAALAFHMAEAHLKTVLPVSTLATMQPWFDTARKVLDEHGNGLAKWPGKVRVLPRGLQRQVPTIQPEVQAAVYQAVLQEKKLRLDYRRNTDESSAPGAGAEARNYVVSPLALVVRDGAVYLVCVFDGHADPRQLALHRTRSAEVLDYAAERPKGFSIDAYITEGELGMPFAPRQIKLEAEFMRHVAIHLRESPISPDQHIEDVDKDNVLLRATVPDTLELRQWLKSFGDEIEVIKPAGLRREFAEMAGYLAGYYRK